MNKLIRISCVLAAWPVLSVSAAAQDHGLARGAFTLGIRERAPVTVKAGEAMVEPPNVEMVGYNRSSTELTNVVVVYVSTPNTPFLDPLH